MIGIGIGINRQARAGIPLPALIVDTEISLVWSSAGGGTVTITPPVTTPAFTGITYAATVDGVAVTVTGSTFPAPQGPFVKPVQVTAIATLAGYSAGVSFGSTTVPAAPAIGFASGPTITGGSAYGAARGLAFTTFGSPTPTAAYQWLVDGSVVPGETASTYSGGLPGHAVQCDITLTNGVSAPVTVRTPPVVITSAAPVLQPIVNGVEVIYSPAVPAPILTPATGGFTISY